MHVLDDPDGFSPRAQSFLRRARIQQPEHSRVPTDFLSVPDRTGRLTPAPPELVISREAFAARFGGLRYDVRRSIRTADKPVVDVRQWRFDLLKTIRTERAGWSFAWYGQHVSSPVSHLVHTDGRFGVSAGGPFLEVCPSLNHLIEGHALMDELADWEPVAPTSLKAWTPNDSANEHLNELLASLSPVAEASGPCERWWRSEHLAIRLFDGWTDVRPRPTGVMIWSRSGRI